MRLLSDQWKQSTFAIYLYGADPLKDSGFLSLDWKLVCQMFHWCGSVFATWLTKCDTWQIILDIAHKLIRRGRTFLTLWPASWSSAIRRSLRYTDTLKDKSLREIETLQVVQHPRWFHVDEDGLNNIFEEHRTSLMSLNCSGRWRFPKPGRDSDPQRHLGGDIAAGGINNAFNKSYKCKNQLKTIGSLQNHWNYETLKNWDCRTTFVKFNC